MNKKMMAFCFVLILFLIGCGKEEAHFTGEISKINDSSIELSYSEDDMDPDASYPTYLVKVNEDTEFSGNADSFKDLTEGDSVKVWVIDAGPDNEINNKVAKKIWVE